MPINANLVPQPPAPEPYIRLELTERQANVLRRIIQSADPQSGRYSCSSLQIDNPGFSAGYRALVDKLYDVIPNTWGDRLDPDTLDTPYRDDA